MTKFEQLLKYITHPHVYIQTHNFPDPDAIASAYGLQQLLMHHGINSTLCYSGKIDRHSTARMIKKLNIELYNIDELSSINTDDEIILVDAQKGNSNIINMTGNEIICIDHHPISDNSMDAASEYRFSDIRPCAGACASIIASYFFENNIPMDVNTATVLCYGIKIDTKSLSRGVSRFDMDMFYNVFNLSNHDIIQELEHCSLQFDDLKAYAAAINSIVVYDNISFANAGHNCPEALIATVSDFMVELQEVDFSVIYSFRSNGVKLSIRSSSSRYDAGSITGQALEGLGGGGGHPSMAGAYIPYMYFNENSIKDEDMIASIIQGRFLRTLGSC